jgi:superfamily I DNA/RNA helicase
MLTMHGAKGLSGKVVFIPSLEQGIMASFRVIQAAGLVIEQRRLFYVSALVLWPHVSSAMLLATQARPRFVWENGRS